jgi:hypothetical protein
MADFDCEDLEAQCPFRIIDIAIGRALCNYYKVYWRTYHNHPVLASSLKNEACDNVRQYELYQEHLAEESTKKTIKMLKNVNIGDSLFWLPCSEDVVLIEKPLELNTTTLCTCQRQNKEIVKIPAHLLRQISKGAYYQEHYIHDLAKAREARILELTARGAGFRVEMKRQKDGFKLKIYGDSQQDVDDFIRIVAENDMVLF